MRPPDDRNPRPLKDPAGRPINHPANIDVAYCALAELRGTDVETLAEQVRENYERLFGTPLDR
jgi:Tat protein secretion system quality control protein TatD with DNase activity